MIRVVHVDHVGHQHVHDYPDATSWRVNEGRLYLYALDGQLGSPFACHREWTFFHVNVDDVRPS